MSKDSPCRKGRNIPCKGCFGQPYQSLLKNENTVFQKSNTFAFILYVETTTNFLLKKER